MNSLLASLKNVVIAPNAVKESTTKVAKESTSKRVEKNPTNGADIRIMHTGKVYPSVDFMTANGLEYTNKNGQTISNGIDLFPALDWTNYSQGGNTTPLLLGYVIRQDQPKVELFAGTRYDESGDPINSVLEQGSVLSQETLNMIAEALGLPYSDGGDTTPWENLLTSLAPEGQNESKYVDLKFIDAEGVFNVEGGKYFIPKPINKGEKKGTMTTVKRENITIQLVTVFDPTQISDNQEVVDQQEVTQQDVEDQDGSEPTTEDISEVLMEATPVEDLLAVHSQFENQTQD